MKMITQALILSISTCAIEPISEEDQCWEKYLGCEEYEENDQTSARKEDQSKERAQPSGLKLLQAQLSSFKNVVLMTEAVGQLNLKVSNAVLKRNAILPGQIGRADINLATTQLFEFTADD